MTDLRNAFDSLVADPPVAPPPMTDLEAGATRFRASRTRRRATVAMVTLAIFTGVVAMTVRTQRSDTDLATGRVPAAVSEVTTPASTSTQPADRPDVASFEPPAGFEAAPLRRATDGTKRLASFGFTRPSTVVQGGIDATINVTFFGGVEHSAPAATTEVDFATSFTKRTGFEATDLGGRRVAILRDAEVLSGQGLGQPDRHGDLFVFNAGSVTVQITTMNASDNDVAHIISSLDDTAAAAVVGS